MVPFIANNFTTLNVSPRESTLPGKLSRSSNENLSLSDAKRRNKPAEQSAVADPSRCNFTNRQNSDHSGAPAPLSQLLQWIS